MQRSRLALVSGIMGMLFGVMTTSSAFAQSAGEKEVYHGGDKTNIDFGESSIDGKMQAPAGFFLQGRQTQSMTQMVKLRAKWRSELRNSKAAVRAIVK